MNLDFSAARVLVIGDVMLDSYWQGETQRISPEAPVPVVHVQDQYQRVGGAANVAMNIQSLGAGAILAGVIGDDRDGQRLIELLNQSGIEHRCQINADFPTTTKLRVLSQHQQLIRADFEQSVAGLDVSVLLQTCQHHLADAQMLVLSDYGKGVLHDAQPFIEVAREANVPVLVDPKKNDFNNYHGSWLITPNYREFEAVVGACRDDQTIAERAGNLIAKHDLGGLLITRGEHGMDLVLKDQPLVHFPAHARDVYDVTGAGDTVIAALATGVASGMSTRDAVFLACKAAGIVVGRVGTASVTPQDLAALDRRETHKLAAIDDKIVNEAECLQELEELKQQGRKIVVTNGCFDLLHVGHVRYLQQAASLGDILVVAVNSDASVRGLKGEGRPVNPLPDRMQVLAALASVDLVVDFNEATPERLICAIEPDVLVKGGDYAVEQIAGRQCAGEVELISLLEGKSSTGMVERIIVAKADK